MSKNLKIVIFSLVGVIVVALVLGNWLGRRMGRQVFTQVPASGGTLVELRYNNGSVSVNAEMGIDSLASQLGPEELAQVQASWPSGDQQMTVNGETIDIYLPDCQSDTYLDASLLTDDGMLYSLLVNGYCDNPELALDMTRQMFESYESF